MKKKALLIAVVAIALAVLAAASVTVAWLTAESEDVTNTFTVGSIEIELVEYVSVDSATTTEVVKSDDFKVVPGGTEVKAPFVKVKGGSESCYVYVLVINSLAVNTGTEQSPTYQNIATLNVNESNPSESYVGWTPIATSTTNGEVKTLYRYDAIVDALKTANTAYVSTNPVFASVTYAGDAITSKNIGDLKDKTIVIKAFAHQSANLAQNENDAQAYADEAAKNHFEFN